MLSKACFAALFVLMASVSLSPEMANAQSATDQKVIFVSVDGLRSDAITTLGPINLPGFYRFIQKGATTLNARNDPDYTITLPNHTSMLTGRFVSGSAGHNWTKNTDPNPGETIHTNAGAYIPSMFDVAHDEGFRTGIFATKSKFEIFFTSWDATNGALDTVLPDFGTSKIDVSGFESGSADVVTAFINASATEPIDLTFLHLFDPDHVGHVSGWNPNPGSVYAEAVLTVDAQLQRLFAFIEGSDLYRGKTTIILTADHGGVNLGHSDPLQPLNFIIPFLVWGPNVAPAQNLYDLNASSRRNPLSSHVARNSTAQAPIRNADGANLALSLLGLPGVPGSTENPAQDLVIHSPVVINPLVTVSFQDGVEPTPEYDGTRDTKIISVDPTTAYGLDPILEMDSEPDYGVLISWDLSSVPSTSRLVEAALIFEITNVTNLDYEFYAVNRWWEEDVATWVKANGDQNWQTAGALGPLDHSGQSLGTITARTTGSYRYDLGTHAIAQIQDWIDHPGTNYGFIFQDYLSGDDGLDMASREATNPLERPRLELIYSYQEVIPVTPNPPVASFEMQLVRGSGTVEMRADATSSTDSDGQIVSFDWDFGDGSVSSGSTTTHSFSTAGKYTVTLGVTDNSGLTRTVSKVVIVDAAGAGARVAEFQDGVSPLSTYSGTRDAKLRSDSTTTNFGSSLSLEIDGSPSDVSLVGWDLTGIAPGVSVTAVSLIFDVVDPSTEKYGVFGLSKPWSEAEATWLEAKSGSAWETAGAGGVTDFSPVKLVDVGPAQLGTARVGLGADGLALVESWINSPSTNNGLVFRDYRSSQNGLDFSSRDVLDPLLRPRLEITYTDQNIEPPPVDPSASLPPVALFDVRLVRNAGMIELTADASSSLDLDGQIVSYAWDFGDGTTSVGAMAAHTFQALGTHTVTLTVTDNSGLIAQIVRPVVVDVHGENQLGFQDGVSPIERYAGTRDSKILSGAKTSNYGNDAVLEMDGSPQNVSLIQWDLSAIAPGVDVLDAVVTFEVVDPTTENFGMFALNAPWEEDTSTWMEAAKGFTWQLGGAGGENDFLPALMADLGPAPLGSVSVPLNADGLDRIESWINSPSSNHGFILRDYGASSDGLDLASREAIVAAARPRIQITYQSQHHAELPEKLTISAYPNPFSDELRIDLASSIYHDVRVELFDMLGRRVAGRELSAGIISGPIVLNTSGLAAGVYALRIIEHASIVSTTRMVTKVY